MGCSQSNQSNNNSNAATNNSDKNKNPSIRKLISTSSSRRLIDQEKSTRKFEAGSIGSYELTNSELELPRLGIVLVMLAMFYSDEHRRNAFLELIPNWHIQVLQVFEVNADSVVPELRSIYGIPFAIMGLVSHATDAHFHSIPFVAFRSPTAITVSSLASSKSARASSSSHTPTSFRQPATNEGTTSHSHSHSQEQSQSSPQSHAQGSGPANISTRSTHHSQPSQLRLQTQLLRTRGYFYKDTFTTTKGCKVGFADRRAITVFESIRNVGLVSEFTSLLARKPSALVVGHGAGATLAALLSVELAVDNSSYHNRKGTGNSTNNSDSSSSPQQAKSSERFSPTKGKSVTGDAKDNKKYFLRGLSFGSGRSIGEQEEKADDSPSKRYTIPPVRTLLYGCPRVFEALTARKLRLLAFHENVVRFICSGDIVPTLYSGEAEHIGEPVCFRTRAADDFQVIDEDDSDEYDIDDDEEDESSKQRGYWVRFDSSLPDLDYDVWLDVDDEDSKRNAGSINIAETLRVERNNMLLYANTVLNGRNTGDKSGNTAFDDDVPRIPANEYDHSATGITLQMFSEAQIELPLTNDNDNHAVQMEVSEEHTQFSYEIFETSQEAIDNDHSDHQHDLYSSFPTQYEQPDGAIQLTADEYYQQYGMEIEEVIQEESPAQEKDPEQQINVEEVIDPEHIQLNSI